MSQRFQTNGLNCCNLFQRRKLDNSIEDINSILDSLCPPPPPLPTHLPPCDSPPPPAEPTPDTVLSHDANLNSSVEHKSKGNDNHPTAHEAPPSKSNESIRKESDSLPKVDKQAGKNVDSLTMGEDDCVKDEEDDVAASLSWDQEVLKKSLKEYLEQVQARKVEPRFKFCVFFSVLNLNCS